MTLAWGRLGRILLFALIYELRRAPMPWHRSPKTAEQRCTPILASYLRAKTGQKTYDQKSIKNRSKIVNFELVLASILRAMTGIDGGPRGTDASVKMAHFWSFQFVFCPKLRAKTVWDVTWMSPKMLKIGRLNGVLASILRAKMGWVAAWIFERVPVFLEPRSPCASSNPDRVLLSLEPRSPRLSLEPGSRWHKVRTLITFLPKNFKKIPGEFFLKIILKIFRLKYVN